jgi:hypothetical protein
MQRLDELGILQHVSVVSSVSGGSLTAAYYALEHDTPEWSWEDLRHRLGGDLVARFLLRAARPDNFARYWLSDLNRSDLMAQVFDEVLFDGQRYSRLNDTTGPKLFVNATDVISLGSPSNPFEDADHPSGQRFVFTQEQFRDLGSRLDRVRVAHAVAASAAFPGLLHPMTLEDFGQPARSEPLYRHLFDGGVDDNLGVNSLLDALGAGTPSAEGCLLLVVDADTGPFGQRTIWRQPDPRSWIDYLVDLNALRAIDLLMMHRRAAVLAELGIAANSPPAARPTGALSWLGPSAGDCLIWHLSFESLLTSLVAERAKEHRPAEKNPAEKNPIDSYYGSLYELVTSIGTNFRLESPHGCSAAALQSAIYQAATVVVDEDVRALGEVCRWLASRGLSSSCPADFGAEQSANEAHTLPCAVSPVIANARMVPFSGRRWASRSGTIKLKAGRRGLHGPSPALVAPTMSAPPAIQ